MTGARGEHQWEIARSKAREFRTLHRNSRDVLTLIYYLIAVQEGCGAEGLSLRSVRYHLIDLVQLQSELSQVIPGPEYQTDWSRPVQDGLLDLMRVQRAEYDSDHGPFSGPPPAEGRIWQLWHALQAQHGVPLEETLTSDEINESVYGRFRASGTSVFLHAAAELTRSVDMLLLPASGAPHLWSKILVTTGIHAGRTGTLRAVTWVTDDGQRTCTDVPSTFSIHFDDRYETADLAPGEVEKLPDWDNDLVVVHAGEPLPTTWTACVLLAAPDASAPWHDEAVELLRQRWREGTGRLVVLSARSPRGGQLSTTQLAWVETTAAWADEILALEPADAGALPELTPGRRLDARDHSPRLTLAAVGSGDGTAPPWARQHGGAVLPSLPDAVEAVLARIGRGHERTAGYRQVPLLVARSDAYSSWWVEHREAGSVLEEARVEWIHRADEDADEGISWWVLRVRLRHRDRSTSQDVVLAHPGLLSVVVYRRAEPWTDTQVVLVPNEAAARGKTREFLRLPTIVHHRSRGDGVSSRAWPLLVGELGLLIESDRLQNRAFRNDSPLISAKRSILGLLLDDREFDALAARLEEAPAGGPEVYRLSDLMTDPVCDWATLGAVMSTAAPRALASRDPWGRRQQALGWRDAVRRATTATEAVHHQGKHTERTWEFIAIRDTIAMVLFALHLRHQQPVADFSWWTVLFYLQDDEYAISLVEGILPDCGHELVPSLRYGMDIQSGSDPVSRRWGWLNRTWNAPPSDGPHPGGMGNGEIGGDPRWDGLPREPGAVPAPDPAIEVCLPAAHAVVRTALHGETTFTAQQRVRVTAGTYQDRIGTVHQARWTYNSEAGMVTAPPAVYKVILDGTDGAVEVDSGQLTEHPDSTQPQHSAEPSNRLTEPARSCAEELDTILARAANPEIVPTPLRRTIAAATRHHRTTVDWQARPRPYRRTWKVTLHTFASGLPEPDGPHVRIWEIEVSKRPTHPDITHLVVCEADLQAAIAEHTARVTRDPGV